MLRKWLLVINIILGSVAGLLALISLWFLVAPFPESEIVKVQPVGTGLPKHPFEQPQEAYDAIGEPFLSLKVAPPTLELPNLESVLTYHGTNKRPDAEVGKTFLHFSLKGSVVPASVAPGEPLYLRYDPEQKPPKYVFSADNEETPLWIIGEAGNGEARVSVRMRNENGEVIAEPADFAHFVLKEKEFLGWKGGKWMLGQQRVDGTLLARQRARWYGEDLFLSKHGGEEFADAKKKQRIDFGEGEEAYYNFVGNGDCLIWDGKRWRVPTHHEESKEYPLLCVKNISDKIINFELWDLDGKRKVILNLIKSTEVWMPQHVEKDFKFVGSRTRTQVIVEVKGERMILLPQEWLVFTGEKWKKLTTEKDIDDYVDRRTVGILFVFEGVDKQQGNLYMTGTLFNATRTATHDVLLPVGSVRTAPSPGKKVEADIKEPEKTSPEPLDEEPPSNETEKPPEVPTLFMVPNQ